ncbi:MULTISPECIES: alanine racemase [unclassified Acinetobacter]|uniref:alanine racemase n=1 Tax=unclassified Acinetobacter TaxID=196816 RepID=UPI0035B8BF2D
MVMDFARIIPPYSPAAWLDLDALDNNIQSTNRKTEKVALRIATKSIRSLDVLHYIRERTPHYVGLMSYSTAESVYLLEQGFDNILCAYPTLDKASIVACVPYITQGAKMVWMVDHLQHWQFLQNIAAEQDCILDICLDINLSLALPKVYFGTKRSSLHNLKDVQNLIHECKDFHYTRLVGVMGYEAQIAGLAENIPDKLNLRTAIRTLKKLSQFELSRKRQKIVKWLQTQGYDLEIVNGGGSGSMQFTSSQDEITEITVGSAYYYPALFSYMDTMQTGFQPASGFVLKVTRHPESQVITCHSGGFIASGSIGREKQAQILYPHNLSTLDDEGFGEVQTPMQANGSLNVTIGDFVWCRHAKAGELCEHFNELLAYRDSKLVQHMITYRGAGLCFH